MHFCPTLAESADCGIVNVNYQPALGNVSTHLSLNPINVVCR